MKDESENRGISEGEEHKSLSVLNTSALKKTGFVPLRYRFILITSTMLLLLLAVLALVLGVLQTRTIQSRIEKQGMAISKNLASISVDHLMTYNYIAIEKLVNQAANNLDIVYVIIHDKEGKVAGYSRRPDLQSKVLKDNISMGALEAKEPFIKIYVPKPGDTKVMEVVVPVFPDGLKNKWGTIRICLSLELMYLQIRQTLWTIFILGSVALFIGILISNWAAQRVTKPLDTLVKATVKAAEGDLKQEISIHTRDEVEILSSNFSIMIREILDQKLLLENQLDEIKQFHQYTEKILSTMSDGLLAVDPNGIVITANPAAHAILGTPDNNALEGCYILDFFKDDVSEYMQQILDSPSNREPREIHLKTGGKSQVLLTGVGVLKSDQKDKGQIILSINDITDIKRLEAKIYQNQRLADLGTLAAGMAHEIRNPLSAIKTFVALLPEKIKKPGFLDKFQRTVPREINRLNNLVEDLLELSRSPKYNFKRSDVGQLLKHSVELLEDDFNSRRINCQCDIPNELPKISADPDQLAKVFINLMQNSAQAMPKGGVISIHVSYKDTWVFIDFKDTGHGFAPGLAQNIFNPFFTTKIRGTGLGLAISHKVVTEHGGYIEAASKKGEGSCFSVSLPTEQPYKSI
jgi:PAS domain S-box-containing protein